MELRVKQYEFGWYIEPYIKLSDKLESVYASNNIISNYLGIFPKDFKEMMQLNGAVDVANDISFFATEEDALSAMPVLQELFDAATTMKYLSRDFVVSRRKKFTVL